MTRVIYNETGQWLNPIDTNIRIQAFLCDTKFLQEPNPYGEYKFSFQPCTMEDEHRLFEHIENAKTTVELGLGPYADLSPTTDVELPNGLPYCNQLFASKLNTEVPFEEWLGNKEASLKFINEKFKEIKNPNKKIIFDIANMHKNAKRYIEAINFYDQILLKMNINSDLYAEILYRRGGSYERSGDYIKADKDLLKSLEANPDDAYVLNYLAYSWLEREHKIDTALKMLEKAYAARSNDPYIIDSIGWAYYLVDEYAKAENFLKRAVELMPQDPIVNDHYGDILWQLDRKIQARYFWQAVLNLDETEDTMKETIKNKLIEGLKNS